MQGTITGLNLRTQTVKLADGNSLPYDQLVIALGMISNDYHIPGVAEYAFPLKSTADAWSLRQHIESEYFDAQDESRSMMRRKLRFIIAGGGPTGVELAGGLAEFRRHLSWDLGIDPRLTSIEICEAGEEILGGKDQRLIKVIRRRLTKLGVVIKTKSPILKEEVAAVLIGDQREATETLIWTAGTKVPPLIEKLGGVTLNRSGRIVVDGYLRAQGFANVWVIGDLAATSDSGTAQIALHHGEYVADNLVRVLTNQPLRHYEPAPPILVMPIGARYAIIRLGHFVIQGWLGMAIRYLADLRYLLSFLPLTEALNTWLVGHRPCALCRMQLANLLRLSRKRV